MSNRKLIRPSLADIKEQMTTVVRPHRKRPSNDQTNAENFYYVKQMQSKTPLVVILQDGEELHGVIEWNDRECLALRSKDLPSIVIMKQVIVHVAPDDAAGRRG